MGRGGRGERQITRGSLYNCSATSSLIDPPVEKDAVRRAAGRLARSLYTYTLVFPKTKFVRPRVAYIRTYIRTFLLRPCGADRRMRFSRAPAYPSRDYLGRESSSLPRSFPSLLPIRGVRELPSRERIARPLSRRSSGSPLSRISECRVRCVWHTCRGHPVAYATRYIDKKTIPDGGRPAVYSWDTCRLKVSENREAHVKCHFPID